MRKNESKNGQRFSKTTHYTHVRLFLGVNCLCYYKSIKIITPI